MTVLTMTSCGGGHSSSLTTDRVAINEQHKRDSISETDAEAERIKKEKEKQERLEAEREEQARLEAEREEQARLEAEREEQARLEAEKAARGPEWLRGGFCHERIDQTFYEIVYEVFYFENDGTYRFGESRTSYNFKPTNRPFQYTVKEGIIYAEDGDPLLVINPSDHSLSRYKDPSCRFVKI